MKLHVIGCHGPYPCAGGATSGYLLEKDGKALLMDCGAGVLGRLMQLFDPAALECVILSHLHFDHASDMLVLRYYLERMGKTLPVYVPQEDASPLRSLLTEPAFRVLPYPEELQVMGLRVTTLPVRHPVPCRAIRITDGVRNPRSSAIMDSRVTGRSAFSASNSRMPGPFSQQPFLAVTSPAGIE